MPVRETLQLYTPCRGGMIRRWRRRLPIFISVNVTGVFLRVAKPSECRNNGLGGEGGIYLRGGTCVHVAIAWRHCWVREAANAGVWLQKRHVVRVYGWGEGPRRPRNPR